MTHKICRIRQADKFSTLASEIQETTNFQSSKRKRRLTISSVTFKKKIVQAWSVIDCYSNRKSSSSSISLKLLAVKKSLLDLPVVAKLRQLVAGSQKIYLTARKST